MDVNTLSSCSTSSDLSNSSVQGVLDSSIELPSPPAIAVRILESVKHDKESFRALAQIISSDPALAAKMLKVANSSIYGLPRRVDTIEMALTVLGCKAVKNIALSFVIASDLQHVCDGAFDFKKFWEVAVTSAVGAEMVSLLLNHKSDDTFVSALLQDIGYLVMFLTRPDDYIQVINGKKESDADQLDFEKKVFGFDHQELGAAMLKNWGLPETIYMPILHHHRVSDSPDEYRLRTSILDISCMLSSVYQGINSAEKVQELQQLLGDTYNCASGKIEKMIDSVAEKASEVLATFEIDADEIKPFSLMLQEANQQLGKLNLSYEQLIVDFKRAKDEAEKLMSELMVANEKLRSMAFRDGLTGLYNHRYFQEILEKELGRFARNARYFSLIIFDIDHFKRINDSYGHLVGDLLLRAIASRVSEITRSSDILARYGGEEFAIVMPETNTAGLRVFGERVRRGIEQMCLDIDGNAIKITISVGGTTVEPGMQVKERNIIIEAADQAVYHSKKNGRNKFTFFPLQDFCGA